jgi:hypothetical protein
LARHVSGAHFAEDRIGIEMTFRVRAQSTPLHGNPATAAHFGVERIVTPARVG